MQLEECTLVVADRFFYLYLNAGQLLPEIETLKQENEKLIDYPKEEEINDLKNIILKDLILEECIV